MSSSAKLERVRLTREDGDEIKVFYFDVSGGGDPEIYTEQLQPGDTIFVKKDSFESNRAYYTSLIGVIATILSTILLFRAVKEN